jgi:tetratricopeptide (TPR) repeat protein
MENRLELLKSMVAQDPGNAFARYGLAMEYSNTGQLEQAAAAFRELIGVNPNYPYAYFHGGQTLEKLGRRDEARDLYRAGILAAGRAGDTHARSEIEAALIALG